MAKLRIGNQLVMATICVAYCATMISAQKAAKGNLPTINATKEVAPAQTLPCFPGAYYRKAASSFDVWTGITGTVKLPMPRVDEMRLDRIDKQPLDNFSIYMGGRGGAQEIDAGLTWEFTLDEHGKRSVRRNAFRPFWRTEKWHSAPDDKKFYWYPGDVVTMTVEVVAPGKLRLRIADATPNPRRVFITEFDAASFAPGNVQQFKRVNAIDQRGNEGRPAQATQARVTGATWSETFLFRGNGAGRQRLPLTAQRMTDMRCPSVTQIEVTGTATERARGAERINIYGAPPSAPSKLRRAKAAP